MNKHWQDTLCPYCGFTNNEHSAECIWPGKMLQYEARRAAGENPVIPNGVDVVVEMNELIDVLKTLEKSGE